MERKWISARSQVIGRTKIRMMYELEAMYDDVVSFTVGEPDFHTPQHIVDACLASLANHRTGYAPNQGVLELRKAISERIAQTHGVVYDPETEILITAGGMNALRSAAGPCLTLMMKSSFPIPTGATICTIRCWKWQRRCRCRYGKRTTICTMWRPWSSM